jgi:hypothetical protein
MVLTAVSRSPPDRAKTEKVSEKAILLTVRRLTSCRPAQAITLSAVVTLLPPSVESAIVSWRDVRPGPESWVVRALRSMRAPYLVIGRGREIDRRIGVRGPYGPIWDGCFVLPNYLVPLC